MIKNVEIVACTKCGKFPASRRIQDADGTWEFQFHCPDCKTTTRVYETITEAGLEWIKMQGGKVEAKPAKLNYASKAGQEVMAHVLAGTRWWEKEYIASMKGGKKTYNKIEFNKDQRLVKLGNAGVKHWRYVKTSAIMILLDA